MCGIAGMVSTMSGAAQQRSVAAATLALAHRGPDDSGLWFDQHCALGHRRLSIIDLSPAGHQPMATTNSDGAGSLQIVFNGEIYNYQSLRAELETYGHRFRTKTDTEVILTAYRQWGSESLAKLRGMFAFAMWDAATRTLFLARDRVGKKPLFFAQTADSFCFASEMQGILQFADVARDINLAALDYYFSWGYIPAPLTGFKGVHKLLPGHWMRVQLSGRDLKTETQRYWQLDHATKLDISEREATAQLREKLTEAVRLRMISDVPLGAFLSGGIDSSIVVGLMAQQSSQRVKTFSVGFREASYNETAYAQAVARKWHTEHTEFTVEPNALEVLPQLVRHFGEPYADSSAIPTYYVAKLTRQHVTVALTGDGGDESFAGYDRYYANRVAHRINSLGFGGMARFASRLLPDSADFRDARRRAKRFLSVAPLSAAQRYSRWMGYFSEEQKAQLYSSEALRGNGEQWLADLLNGFESLGAVESAMATDVVSYLPNDLLVKVDIATMASSLEARSPFLDHQVMEFAAKLPTNLKLNGRNSKYILKQAFADLLPDEVKNRGKLGFGVPVGNWFRGPLTSFLRDTLSSSATKDRGLLNGGFVQKLVEEHVSGRADYGYQLWTLLALELWFQEVAQQKPAAVCV
jgi:asparagine synthase (glutamine-hydrolysing)